MFEKGPGAFFDEKSHFSIFVRDSFVLTVFPWSDIFFPDFRISVPGLVNSNHDVHNNELCIQ